MSRLDDLHTLVRLLQEFELPVSPILEYSIKEKEEELMQNSAEEHAPINFEQATVSATAVKQKKKGVARTEINEETPSICGALKIMATLDNKNADLIRVIKALGNISTSAHRIEVAKRLVERAPYYTEIEGVRRAVDKVRVMNEDGTTRIAYILRTAWSPAKIIEGIKCYVGESIPTYIPIDQIEDAVSSSTRQKIEVRFPEGKVIQPNRVYEAVVEVVKYAGPKRVRDLNITVCGDNLILRNPKPRYITACKSVGDGWYVNTCSCTQQNPCRTALL